MAFCEGQTISPANPPAVCSPSTVALSVNGGTGITQYQWIKDNIDILNATSITYTATATGSYKVRLIGPAATDTTIIGPVTVTVNSLPATPSFTFSTNNQCASLPFSFVVTSTVPGVTYTWDFGDGITNVNGTSVNHLYDDNNSIGNGTFTYSVIVTAKNAAGCTVQSGRQNVTIKQKPSAKLGGTGSSTYLGLAAFKQCQSTPAVFNFVNQSTTTNTNYKIIWGDGFPNFNSPTFSTPVQHTYSVGPHNLTFIVDGNGCSDTVTYNIFVGKNPQVVLGNPGNTVICTEKSLTFPIDDSTSVNPLRNPPGTFYTITVDETNPPRTFSYTQRPDSFNYPFLITSCGLNTSTSFPNSINVQIVASNPCGVSPSTVGNIIVSKKPKALFNISPKGTVCVNSIILITNASECNSVTNSSCDACNKIWTVSPSTGWTSNTTNFGNDFGLNDPTTWDSGSNTFSLNFTQPGTYTIKLKTGNTTDCGSDSIIKTICVNPTPVANFSIDQSIGCAPLNVSTTNTPSTNNCGNNTYTWSVTYAATTGCQPATSDFIYLNGTNANSINPQFQFKNPGVYTINLTATSPGGACISTAVTKIVTVKGKPVVTIAALGSACVNDAVSPTVTSSCYTDAATYAWSFPGATPLSSANNPPASITYNTPGTKTITLDVTNECGVTTATKIITINTVTPADAGPAQNKCGNSVTMAANTSSIGMGQWTKISGPTNPITINSSSSPTTTINGLVAGTYIFRWTISNGSCSSTSDVTITIAAGATTSAAGADQNLCLNTFTTITGNTPVVGTGAWSQVSGPNTATIVSANSPSTNVTGLLPGIYNFRWTISFSNCTPNIDDVQVVIYDNPSAANAGTDQTICSANTALAGNTPASGKGTGIWSQVGALPNIATITNPTSSGASISKLVAGAYKFKWTISNGPCATTQDTVDIIVTQVAPTANAGADINLCAATTVNLAGNTTTVGNGVWTNVNGPAGFVISNPALPTTSVSGLVTGNYTFRWTITNGNCPASFDDVRVIVDEAVTVAAAGPVQNVCGVAVTMAANTAAVGNGIWSYVSGPAGSVITNPTLSTTTITNLAPGNYVFKWTITNGSCSSSSNVAITIFAGASPAVAGNDQQLCLATSTSLTAVAPVTGTGVWTQLSGDVNNATIANANTNTTLINDLVPGIYNFRWIVSFSNCTPLTDTIQVIIFDNPTKATAGADQTVCADNITLAANNPTSGTGKWSQLSGTTAVITNTASNTSTVTGLTPGIYKFIWTISNGPCSTSKDTVEINVTEVATTAKAGSAIRQCAVSSVTLAANTASVGTGVWLTVSGPAGAQITNPSLPNTTVTSLVPGTYLFRWTITNGNCPPSSDSVQVIIDSNVTVANAGAKQEKCGDIVTMAANTATVGTGLWSYVSGPSGSTISSPSLPATTIIGLVPGNYVFRWTITNGTCSSTSDVPISIFSGASAALAGDDQNLCLNTTSTLNATSPAIGTGAWTQVSGAAAGITNPLSNISAITGLVPGIYLFRWTVSFSNCPAKTDDVQVTIYANPSVAAAGTDQVICADNVLLSGNTASIGNGEWSQLAGPNNAVFTNKDLSTTTVTGLIPGIYQFAWTISNGPCTPSTDIVAINVSAIASAPDAGVDQILCAATIANLTATAPQVGTGSWSFVSGPTAAVISTAGLTTTSVTGLIPGNYIFRWTITNGACPPRADDVEIVILNNLQNSIEAPIDTTCAGQSVTVNGIIPTGGTGVYTYQWQQSPDGVNWTNINNETSKNFSGILNTTTYFRRKVSSMPCENFSNEIKIVVQPGITNNSISSNESICINTQSPTIKGSNPTGGDGVFLYQWRQSIDAGQTWDDIAGATNFNYNPGVLIQTTHYRRLVSTALCSGPQSNFSNVVIITINPDSKAIFTSNPTVNCAPFDLASAITVTELPDNNATYNWYENSNFFAGNSTGIFPGFTIINPGDTVVIKLVTTSPFGCKSDSVEQRFITVTTAIANFTKDTASGCSPLIVNFTNTSNIIKGIRFFWDFGNGLSSNDAQPAPVTFLQSPFYNDTTYQITLKAFNGCDTTYWRDSVKIRSKPKAKFGVVTTFGCSPFTVKISNNSLGTPNTYYWDFGNGHRDTTIVNGPLTYTYNIGNAVDTFPIRLIAVNECGSDTQIIKIRVAPNLIKPQVTINATDLFGCSPHIVAFNNASTGATSFIWNYGDGSVPDTTNTRQSTVLHTFTAPGTFNVVIQMTNGCSDTTITKQVTVFAKPVAAFTTSASSYCLGDTIRVNNTSLNASNYTWFWGDGQRNTGVNPVHVYNVAGNYSILLRAEKTNNNGIVCFDTLALRITILIKPDVTLQSNIANINCAPFTINATAPGIINEDVTWYITDTTVTPSLIIQKGFNASYTFNKPGTFSVKMIAVNAIGCADSTIKTFVVRGTPVASFSPNKIAICKTDTTVSYLNTTTFNDFGPLTYRWLVDDLLKGTNGNFTYQYFSAPNVLLPKFFITQMIATNSVGCSDTAVGTLQMNPNAKALFSFGNTNQCVPFVLPVNNASQDATKYQWHLNGILADTTANPAISITKPLTAYAIRLIADNGYGCKPDTLQLAFTSRIKPAAAFTLSDTLGCTGFLNITTVNRSTNASSYVWDWGDATAQSSFTNPSHLYNTQGQYVISLVASDDVCKDTAYKNVVVSKKPIVDFSVNDSATCDTARIQFINLTTGADNYLWRFSDGNTSTLLNPLKNFAPAAAAYSVKLVAYNKAGCSDSVTKANIIKAIPLPVADFFIAPSPLIYIPDYTFSFNNLSLDNIKYTYQWSVGDGTFAATRNIINHRYADTGQYTVQLIVLDNNTGCPDTVSKVATIAGKPGHLYVPNAFYPNSIQNQFKTFKPLGKGLATYRLQIFDGWGRLLFETKSLNPDGSPQEAWDGRYKGVLMQQDAYVWKIEATFRNGTSWNGMSYNNGRPQPFGSLTLFY